MQISVNGETIEFGGRTLAELIERQAPQTPFAAAVNTRFIPKADYHSHMLQNGDQIDIVRPVVGG
ncbi:sulfur carrier protein ThiS [Uruburuella testudinis]|uniref:Sulfur carrier protein ThiS n=1 Tax=Uruburuella testudinis TaxID=1282863 RepID=A0ABY4DSG5_9NEIS|nr:sulfur carrier protein ThiS [Uruburuella testudinis]UOO81970.1 sulfur carrier protein ThiS [Uruburuella testudinis]